MFLVLNPFLTIYWVVMCTGQVDREAETMANLVH